MSTGQRLLRSLLAVPAPARSDDLLCLIGDPAERGRGPASSSPGASAPLSGQQSPGYSVSLPRDGQHIAHCPKRPRCFCCPRLPRGIGVRIDCSTQSGHPYLGDLGLSPGTYPFPAPQPVSMGRRQRWRATVARRFPAGLRRGLRSSCTADR